MPLPLAPVLAKLGQDRRLRARLRRACGGVRGGRSEARPRRPLSPFAAARGGCSGSGWDSPILYGERTRRDAAYLSSGVTWCMKPVAPGRGNQDRGPALVHEHAARRIRTSENSASRRLMNKPSAQGRVYLDIDLYGSRSSENAHSRMLGEKGLNKPSAQVQIYRD